jgi:cytochrome c
MARIFSYALAAALAASPAFAADHGSANEARSLLDKAVAKLTTDGPQKAFAAFNDKRAGFVDRDLYVFVFDMEGKYMASGANAKLAGTDAHELKDAEGKPIVREMVEMVGKKDAGEIDYVWLNRVENRVEKKHSLIRRVNDYILGVGYYE